ncbi:hypothetical protein [Streptomyces sp. NPDC056883]|uniref:hypothetical protein n=1 Tax=Streptomyces sp. NPDC056883 TaxID=3345959 RepID=UPI0036CB71A0
MELVPRLAATSWLCRHDLCGKAVRVLVAGVVKGTGCTWCAGRRTSEELRQEMLDRGFKPRVPPLPRMNQRWESTHIRCGNTVYPILVNLRQRPDQHGCPYCSKVAPITHEIAVQRMGERGATPVGPFLGRSAPWNMLCHRCRQVSERCYKRVMRGHGCRFCDKQGFDWAGPAVVYVMVDEALKGGAGKTGIASARCKRDRFSVMRGRGWSRVYSYHCETGILPYEIEQAALDVIREVLEGAQFLSQQDLPQNGATETFSLADLSTEGAWHVITKQAGKIAPASQLVITVVPGPRLPDQTESQPRGEQLAFDL